MIKHFRLLFLSPPRANVNLKNHPRRLLTLYLSSSKVFVHQNFANLFPLVLPHTGRTTPKLTSSSTGENLNPVLRSPRPNFSRLMVPVLMGSSQRKNSRVRSRDLRGWLMTRRDSGK